MSGCHWVYNMTAQHLLFVICHSSVSEDPFNLKQSKTTGEKLSAGSLRDGRWVGVCLDRLVVQHNRTAVVRSILQSGSRDFYAPDLNWHCLQALMCVR